MIPGIPTPELPVFADNDAEPKSAEHVRHCAVGESGACWYRWAGADRYIGLNDSDSGVGDGIGGTTAIRKPLRLIKPANNGGVTAHPFWAGS